MNPIIELRDVSVSYNGRSVLKPVSVDIYENQVTAIIGSSGSGKSTFIRAMNRMNELIPHSKTEGQVLYRGLNIYNPDSKSVDPVEVRRHIGMVFQKPNPFPKSIYENVAWGARINGYRGNMDEHVEYILKKSALWDEVKDNLKKSAYALSGGQQQRLCIARALAVNPDVILMDEPCSALDPIATKRIEDLINEFKKERTIVLVTHNIQQAARIADWVIFLNVDDSDGSRKGYLHHFGTREDTFVNPKDKTLEDYVTGRFG
ncbi:TPA: phosphate ABC transporter ATP-binding protein [Candidatus Woesearchaeota archaeon]|nr:Phosphate ABC transporter ATP-binding protein [archaeon GW2011_AR15]MBS3104377.1 phosphate ABC transporter ATP-binding protein [Candidatus Woesearchaeota archaeon]HIH41310.1 phosphate ABC transporter ATP-binding protein [Candidatus Woesearchaeota archaeon]